MFFVNYYEKENMLAMFYKFLIILAPILSIIVLFLIFKTIFYICLRIRIRKKDIDINKLRYHYNLFIDSNKVYHLLNNISTDNEIDKLIKRDIIDRLNPNNFDLDYSSIVDENTQYDGISIYSDDSDNGDIEKCSICLSNIENFIHTELYCKHKFHLKCLNEWVKNSNECPLCKRIILERIH